MRRQAGENGSLLNQFSCETFISPEENLMRSLKLHMLDKWVSGFENFDFFLLKHHVDGVARIKLLRGIKIVFSVREFGSRNLVPSHEKDDFC